MVRMLPDEFELDEVFSTFLMGLACLAKYSRAHLHLRRCG